MPPRSGKGITASSVHFDDRLATVLHHRAAGARAARVQFRQLLDLLGEPAGATDPALVRAAYRRLDALAPLIPLAQRERIAAECSARIRNPLLIAWFAGTDPRLALAALSRATLGEQQWSALIPELPVHARGLLRHRRNLPRPAQLLLDQLGVRDRVLPEPEGVNASEPAGHVDASRHPATPASASAPALELGSFAEEDYVLSPAPGEPAAAIPNPGNLSALVERIEAFQRARARRGEAGPDSPRLPLGGDLGEERAAPPLGAFLFTTDDSGRIDWAEAAAAPLVVGTLLAAPGRPQANGFAYDFALRRPVVGADFELGGAERIAGRWTVDAAPQFAPRGGRFTGYLGRFRRPAPTLASSRAERAADRVRQLLHELRTPVTAIQGFAEVIQQQTVGPVPHEYRALAAEIAGDAARMLAGFAEIERFARLEAGTQDFAEGTSDFVTVVRRQVAQLQTVLGPRVSRIDANWELQQATVPLAPECAEMLAWRFLGTLAAATAAGERLALALAAEGDCLRLSVQLPAALAHAQDVFAGDIRAGGALPIGLLGAGFALRLARAEARAVGGDLVRDGLARMILTLPLGEAQPAPEVTPHRATVRAGR